MFEEYEKELRQRAIKMAESANNKKTALELIDTLLTIEAAKDAEHVKLLAEKKIYRHGESVISHHLKVLKELVEKI